MRCFIHWLFLAAWPALALAEDCEMPSVAALHRPPIEMRLKLGDDPRWAAPEWDDRDWEKVLHPVAMVTNTDGTLPTRTGPYWVRFRIERSTRTARRPVLETFFWPPDEPGSPINSVFLPAAFSYDFYWDGRLISRSGVVGHDRASEIPGPLDQFILLPDDLRGPGPHVVALRLSNYHYSFPAAKFGIYFAMENYRDRLVYETRQPLVPMIGAGGALLIAAICVVLYFAVDRRRPLLLLGLVSLLIALFYLLIARRWLHADPYSWLFPRYVLTTGIMTLISLVVPWLLMEQFGLNRRLWALAALLPFLGAAWYSPMYYWDKSAWMCRAMLGFSLVIAGWAAWRRRPGALFVLVGVVVGLVSIRAAGRGFLAPSLFVTFGALVVSLLIALGVQIQADRRREREARLTNVRLEIELLKKNIQPHFLLNTLATIIETIEQEPKMAVTFVEALAGEFRILSRVAGEKLIPLGQELELCRAHLRMMSQRKGVHCALTAAGVDEQARVPPALFHTLVENGLTHLLPRAGRIDFELRGERALGVMHYILLARGARQEAAADSVPRLGTGLRYIHARLEESFPGRWTLRGEPVPDGWRTVIDIAAPGTEKGFAS